MGFNQDRLWGQLPTTPTLRWTCPARTLTLDTVRIANLSATPATVTITLTPGPGGYDLKSAGNAPFSVSYTVPAHSAAEYPFVATVVYGDMLTDSATHGGLSIVYEGFAPNAWEYADLHAEISADLEEAQRYLYTHTGPPTVETVVPWIGACVLSANGNSGLSLLGPVDSNVATVGPTTAPPVAAVSAPGSALDTTLSHQWCVSFIYATGIETLTGPLSAALTVSANIGARITLPLGGAQVIKRCIYRLAQGERADYATLSFGTARAYAHLVAEVADNTTTTYTDVLADAVVQTHRFPVVGYTTDSSGAQVPDNVDAEIKSLSAMGCTMAALNAQFPTMSPFSVNGTPNALYDDRYLAFYKKCSDMVRAAGLHLIIECNTMFGGTYGPSPDYTGATWSAFIADKGQAVQSVITLCQPEYVNLLAEPTTITSIIHFSDLPGGVLTIANVTDYINACVPAGFNKGITKVGSGNFPQNDGTVAWNIALLAIPALDGIDLHTFNLDGDSMANIITLATAAHAAGKDIWSSETGLFLSRHNESVSSQSSALVYRRDAFTDMVDLQILFADVFIAACRRTGLRFASFFWGSRLSVASLLSTVHDPAGNPSDRIYYHGQTDPGAGFKPSWALTYPEASRMMNQLAQAGRNVPTRPDLSPFGVGLSDIIHA
jgi:hypothetical protein